MPSFGSIEAPQIPGGVGIVQSFPIGDPRNLEVVHKQMQQERMSAPDELEAITELSEQTKVYVYSVGAWPQFVSLGSLGSYTIQGIPEENVLKPGDLTVSKPLVVNGIPSETYPVDDGGRRIYHRPQKHDPLRKHTGMHLALEIIGAGAKSKVDNDLRPWGCFASTIPEQKRPDADAPPQAHRLFSQWRKTVEDAKSALAANFAKRKGAANEAFKKGTFQALYLNDDRIGIIARVTNATKAECPWMENMVTSVENKPCIACEKLISATAIICSCGQKQVSDRKYDEEIARRMKVASGESDTQPKKRGRPSAASAAAAEPEDPPADEPDEDIV